MRDITAQLDSYQDHLDALYPPVTADDVYGINLDTPPARPGMSSPLRLRALAFVAAFAVILGFGGLVFLVQRSVDGPATDDVSPTVASTTPPLTSTPPKATTSGPPPPTTGPTVLPSMDDLLQVPGAWTEVPGGVAGALAASDGLGVVAAGGSENGNRIWFSPDGDSWELTELPEGGVVRDVTAGGPGFVAVGRSGDVPAIWVSEDGSSWERLPDEALPVEAEASAEFCCGLQQVVAGLNGLVATGVDARGIATWMSTDGLQWRRATTPPDMHSDFQAIASSEEGWIYIDTTSRTPGGVYLSSDGSTWTQLAHIPDVKDSLPVLRALPDGRLVFADSTSDGRPRILISSDGGRTWIAAAIAPLPESTPDFVYFNDLAVTDYGLIAVAKAGDPRQRTYLFHSIDGNSWTATEPDPIFEIVPFHSRLFISGIRLSLRFWEPTSDPGTTDDATVVSGPVMCPPLDRSRPIRVLGSNLGCSSFETR